jgi:fumarate reductase subunit D
VAAGETPPGLEYSALRAFAASWIGKAVLFIVISLALWHAAHRLRVVFHDFGVRRDKAVANAVYLVAAIGTALTAFYLYAIR